VAVLDPSIDGVAGEEGVAEVVIIPAHADRDLLEVHVDLTGQHLCTLEGGLCLGDCAAGDLGVVEALDALVVTPVDEVIAVLCGSDAADAEASGEGESLNSELGWAESHGFLRGSVSR
jgi:hypothetical protein